MAPKGQNWFDSPDWSPEAQAEFESKWGRAQKKGECRRTKGAALIRAGDRRRREAGRNLLLRLVEEYPETLTVSWAHEFISEAYVADGEAELAERHYRQALGAYKRIRGARGHADIRLADLITRTHQREKYAEAVSLVDSYEPLFKIDYFRVFIVRARLAAADGDEREAREYARAALELEAETEPQLPRHPDVGHVRTDKETLSELRRLAGQGVD